MALDTRRAALPPALRAPQLAVLTNPAGQASARAGALRLAGSGDGLASRGYADGLQRWARVTAVPPYVLRPAASLSPWASSVDHSTSSPSISGARTFTKLFVGDRVRLRGVRASMFAVNPILFLEALIPFSALNLVITRNIKIFWFRLRVF